MTLYLINSAYRKLLTFEYWHEIVYHNRISLVIRQMVIISIFQSRVKNIIKHYNFYTVKESSNQSGEVNIEKKIIYEPTVPYILTKHNLDTITVIGLFFGSWSTISKFFVNWRKKYKIQKKVQDEIITSIIKNSVAILRNHLYATKK